MSIRHLDTLFAPASVAVFGASERPSSVGATGWRNLREGGYQGRLYSVNPKHREIGGVKSFRHVRDLPEAPDLAVICTPPATVVDLIRELGARGTRAAVVVTAVTIVVVATVENTEVEITVEANAAITATATN